MKVALTAHQAKFIAAKMKTGGYLSTDEIMREALRVYELVEQDDSDSGLAAALRHSLRSPLRVPARPLFLARQTQQPLNPPVSEEQRMEVFVRHDAELDALGYFQYLHERDPGAAVRFLAAIDRYCGRTRPTTAEGPPPLLSGP